MNRRTYLLGALLGALIIVPIGLGSGELERALHVNNDTVRSIVSYIGLIPAVLVWSTCYARRLHDIGASARWLAFLLIPLVAPALGLLLLAIPGDAASNKYGPPPLHGLDLRTLLVGTEKDTQTLSE